MAHPDCSYSDDPYGEAMHRITDALAHATSNHCLMAMSEHEFNVLEALKDMLAKQDAPSYGLMQRKLHRYDDLFNPSED